MGIFVLAPDFTKVFMGEKWMPMVPAIKVLAFAGLIRSIAATTGPILYGIGKPKIDTIWQTVRLILLIALVYPLTMRWGILGTSIAVLCSISVSTFGFSLGVIRITKCGIYNFLNTLILPALNSLIMTAVIIILKGNIELTGFFPLLLLVSVGTLTYFFITKLYDRFLNYEIGEFVRKTLILR
jgi:O-antigen/teichoic acid export membrane protein